MPKPNSNQNDNLVAIMKLLNTASQLDADGRLPKPTFSNEFDPALPKAELENQKKAAKTAEKEALIEYKTMSDELNKMPPNQRQALKDLSRALKQADSKGADGKRPDPQTIIQNFFMGLLESTQPTTEERAKMEAATDQLVTESMNNPSAVGAAMHLYQAAEHLERNDGYGNRDDLFNPNLFDTLKESFPNIKELANNINPSQKPSQALSMESCKGGKNQVPKWVAALATLFKAFFKPLTEFFKRITKSSSHSLPNKKCGRPSAIATKPPITTEASLPSTESNPSPGATP